METVKECDCMKIVAEKIKENILATQSEKQKGFNLLKGEWEYFSWFPKMRMYVNFILTSTFEKKDGSISKPKKDHVSIFFTYRPFCGQKLKNE